MHGLLLVALAGLLAGIPLQETVEQEVQEAVRQFYATQQAEDLAGYLALWSRTARRPEPTQLKFIFDSGDDTFTEIAVTRVTRIGERVRVRASALRSRTVTGAAAPEGRPTVYNTRISTSLTYVREDGALKLVSEGSPADDLAAALLEAATPADREALLAADADLLGDTVITALSRRAGDLARTGDYKGARGVFERVLEVAQRKGDRKAEGEALQNIANAHYFLQDFAGALPWYERRLTLEREQANAEGIAAALLGVATIRYSFYEYTAAMASYREALAIQEKIDDRVGISTTLISIGNIGYLQGDYAAAAADYRRSHGLARKAFYLSGAARALEGLGRALVAQGDFAGALQAYAGVLEEGRARGDRSLQGNATLSVAEIHFRLANIDTARKLFEDSRNHFLALNDKAHVGRSWQGSALTELVASRFPAAEEAYGKSAAACAAAADPECVAQATVGVAFAQWAQSRYDDSIASYRKAIAAFAALHRNEEAARAEIGLSQACLGKGDAPAALAAAQRAREAGVALGRDDVVWRARVAEARASRKAETAGQAMAAALDAVAAVERMARASLDNPVDVVPADSASAYALLAVLQAGAGDAAAAFATIERGRVHALRAALARNERDIARGMTPEEREEERRAAADLVSLRVQLDHERKLPKPDPARIERLQAAVSDAMRARTALRERHFARLPQLRIARGLVQPATAEDVASALPEDGTLLAEFVLDDDDLLIVTARRVEGKIELAAEASAVSRKAIAERIAAMLEPNVLRDTSAWRKAASELVAAFPPTAFARMAASSRLLIAPDDVLWRVPFEALPLEGGWIADRTSVAAVHSLSALVRGPEPPTTAAANRALIVTAPDIPVSVRERFSATAPGWTVRATSTAEAEAQRVAAAYDPADVAVLSAAAASEGAWRAAAPSAAVLHIAAPFRVNSASPLFSPVLLGAAAADTIQDDDGVVSAHEVTGLQLAARAVVLSDGTALAMRDAAAAVPVVQWTWRVAGVPAFVLRRWDGEAPASAEFLGHLHARLASGAEPAVAVHEAAAALRAREETRAPFFWAGWLVVGGKF